MSLQDLKNTTKLVELGMKIMDIDSSVGVAVLERTLVEAGYTDNNIDDVVDALIIDRSLAVEFSFNDDGEEQFGQLFISYNDDSSTFSVEF